MPVRDRVVQRIDPSAAKRGYGRVSLPGHAELMRHLRDRLMREANLEELLRLPDTSRRSHIEQQITGMLEEEGQLITFEERLALINSLLDETMGYGPLQVLMDDPNLTEIMVNKPDEVYVEVQGQPDMELRRDVRFNSEQHILEVIDRIVAPLGRRIDESSPMVDARLPDGSRVNAVIRPLALDGPILTIRRFRKAPFTAEDLVGSGTVTRQMMEFLAASVKSKLNILVSGGTGSGKTTTLNVLAAFIPHNERIVTIEDAAELRFYHTHPHVVRMEARPSNIEGTGAIPIRQLVRNALRMRPNRIVVGEVRGEEALDMLQAMNTGHEGSLTTLHANSTGDAFSRLETMVMQGGINLPLPAIRSQVISALNLVLQQDRLVDNTRRVSAISEVLGVDGKGEIQTQDIFVFAQEGVDQETGRVLGHFAPTGNRPRCLDILTRYGQAVPESIFEKDSWILRVDGDGSR